jgi:hypothetical protein
MTNNISGFGAVVTLVASGTFPAGFVLTQFADDADPLDMPSISIGDTAMGLNGDLITWRKAVPLPATLSVIPGSDDDINLAILAAANRSGKGTVPANDIITITIVYPDGTVVTLINGVITDAPFGKSIASAGRLKSKSYAFKFEGVIGV